MWLAAKAAWVAFKASRLFQWGAIAVAAVGAFLIVLGRAERRGAERVENEILKDRVDRMEAGNEAVQREQEETRDASNRDLVDRLRGRDGDWGGV